MFDQLVRYSTRNCGGVGLTMICLATGRIAIAITCSAEISRRSSPLHLGVIPSVAPYVLPALLPLVREKFPDLDLHLRETQDPSPGRGIA